MTDQDTKKINKIILSSMFLWTLIIASFLLWNYYLLDQQTNELIHREALANFNKDQAFRGWGTKHGGVYVPSTEETPPSPFMAHIPERDIETPSGKKLTLLNPAYMLRQMMDDFDTLYGVKGKITELILLRPENAPDPWERQALLKLKAGQEEVIETSEINGMPYYRLMRPMYMLPGCDKCHGHLGFKTGDFRGGVGVSIPLAPFLAVRNQTFQTFGLTHLLIWILGLLGLGFGGKKVRETFQYGKRSERALQVSEKKLSSILQLAPEAVFTTDKNGLITMFNDGASKIFGYSSTEIIGKSVETLIPKPLRTDHQHHITNFTSSKKDQLRLGSDRMELYGLKKNGEEFPTSVSISKIMIDGEMILNVVLQDTTTQKSYEKALIIEKEKAIFANRSKTEFLAHMSHELRTPLNAILGFSEIIEKEIIGPVGTPKYKEYAADIQSSGNHLLALISDILDISKVETGNIQLEEENFYLSDVFETTINMMKGRARTGKVTLKSNLDDSLSEIYADKRRLKQIILNLLSNALKFTPPGGRVDLFGTRLENNDFIIQVKDTGRGISKEDLPKILEPFAQGRQNISQSHEPGTGLGLALVKSLIELHGGSIKVESETNKGTTVILTFPANRIL